MQVSSVFLKRAAQSLRRLPRSTAASFSRQLPYSLSQLCAGLHLRLPVYPHLSLRCLPVTTGLYGVMEGGWVLSCADDFLLSEEGLRDINLCLSPKTISIQWQE